MTLPLDGLCVVALEQAVAAPLCTRHLADLGADVIKVERPDGGDFARRYDSAVKGQSAYFVWLNRGKRSIALDLARAEEKLAAADVPFGSLNTVADLVAHPQLSSRGRWVEVETPGGSVRALVPPFNVGGVEPRMAPIPALDAHGEEIRRELRAVPGTYDE